MTTLRQTGLSLQPRSIGRCVDLAVHYVGQRFTRVGLAWLMIAGPGAIGTWLAASWTDYGWLAALIVLTWGSVPLGALLVTDMASVLFDQPLTISAWCWRAWIEGVGTLLLRGLFRLPLLAIAGTLILPLMLLVALGFQTEKRVVRQFRKGRLDHRTGELVRTQFAELLVRAGGLMAMGLLLWLLLILTLDAGCTLLTGWSPMWGEWLASWHDPWGVVRYDDDWLIWDAGPRLPSVWAGLVVTGLASYGVLRMAWFLTFIDLRVRCDLWDLELAMADEARQLGAMS